MRYVADVVALAGGVGRKGFIPQAETHARPCGGFEGADGTPRAATVAAIRAALETAGVEFIAENGGGPGVRLRKGSA